MFILLIFLLMICFLVSFFLFNRDLLSPSTVICIVFIFSTICALYNKIYWGLELSEITVMFIISGIVSFIIGSFVAFLTKNITSNNKIIIASKKNYLNEISINNFMFIIVVLIECITIMWIFVELKNNAPAGLSWFQIVKSYRNNFFVDPDEVSQRFPKLLSEFISLCTVNSYIFLYIFINNIFVKEKKNRKKNLLYILPVILTTINSFMQGYRGDMVRYWVAFVVLVYIIKERENGWIMSKSMIRIIMRIGLSVILIAVAFSSLREVVGRLNSLDKDPFYYITFYAGCPIACLDDYLKSNIQKSEIWGKETFYSLNQGLSKRLNKPELSYKFPKEHRLSPTGVDIGNVYTALRAPYADFGWFGMVFITILFGYFFSFFYYKVHIPEKHSKIDFSLMLYSYFAYTLFMYFYNNYYFFISFKFIKLLMYFYIVRWILVGDNFFFSINNKKKIRIIM